MNNTLGSQLKAARIARGLSGYKVAALAGIKPTHLYDIENGHRLYPRQATVNRIAAVLGCTVTVSVVAVEEQE